jgi:bacterioferritin (cytochrome b1)
MEKLSQEYVLSLAFHRSIVREDLLLKKYTQYYPQVKDKNIKNILKEFEQSSEEHIKLLKDKMIKLNIHG